MCQISVKPLILFLFITSSAQLNAKEHVIDQKNKQFTPTEITISVGDRVKFTNSDPMTHNVFSLSETKLFDLGSYRKGEERSVKFDKPGEVEVECLIHPYMRTKIIVE